VLRLDFFPECKGIDAVLLSADSDGIRAILDALSHAIATPSEELPLHDIAHVAQRQPARLFLTTTRPAPNVVTSNTYYWVVSENEALTVSGLLEPLASITAGHQFFGLGSPGCLIDRVRRRVQRCLVVQHFNATPAQIAEQKDNYVP
jgi:hypothetical protein